MNAERSEENNHVSSDREVESDRRPAVAIGHVTLRVSEIGPATEFYRALGMRGVMQTKNMAILELRGGTHLLLFRTRGKPRIGPVRSFDFIVDDVDAFRGSLLQRGIAATEIGSDTLSGHRWFQVTDPDGHDLRVYSTHVEGREV
jgi:catechol 2,3-dioxygenase-like lactoylglutathione lyase family enzyme